MKIRHLRYSEINKERWDACIDGSVNGTIYAYSWYLDIVSPEWEALVLGDYDTVFPLTCRKKFGIKYLSRPLLCQQLGIFSVSLISPDLVNRFLEAIPSSYKLINISLNIYNRANHSEFLIRERPTCQLDLISPYEILYAKYNQNTSRNIKKAIKAKLSLSHSLKPEAIIYLFQKNTEKRLFNTNSIDYKTITRLLYQIIAKGKGRLWGAFTAENNLCAAVFFAESNQKAIYLFAASNEEARQNGAMSLIINTFIHSNAGKNLTLDFEGSAIPNVARFYKGFGAEASMYQTIYSNRLPFILKWIKS